MPESGTKIKICGITSLEDALCAAKLHADFLGFIFHPPSPRYIQPQKASAIIRSLREIHERQTPRTIGVFVNSSLAEIKTIRKQADLDGVQLHGNEPTELLDKLQPIKFRSMTLDNLERLGEAKVDAWLCDTHDPQQHGGTGRSWDYDRLRPYIPRHRIIIAGGLDPKTVGDIVARLKPWGVDVSSGVEQGPGKKDHDKVRAFIQAVRSASNA